MERTQSPLTNNERHMIVSAHKYFSGAQQGTKQRERLPLRKQVAVALGIGEATVGRVVSDWNCRNDGLFTPHETLGRPITKPDDNIAELIRNFVKTANLSGAPLSTPILRQKLSEHSHMISKWKLLRLLHFLGYYYGRGERRNIHRRMSSFVAVICTSDSKTCKAIMMFRPGRKFSWTNLIVISITIARLPYLASTSWCCS